MRSDRPASLDSHGRVVALHLSTATRVVVGGAVAFALTACSGDGASGWGALSADGDSQGIQATGPPAPQSVEALAAGADVVVVGTVVDVDLGPADARIDQELAPVAGVHVRISASSNPALVGEEVAIITARDPGADAPRVADQLRGAEALWFLDDSAIDGWYDPSSSYSIIIDTGGRLEMAHGGTPDFLTDAGDTLGALLETASAHVGE